MRAVVVEHYDSIDGISIRERDLPGVAAGEVRVKIGAAAVGFVDGLKVQGLYQTKDPLPFVPGTEFAGIVDAVADDVTAFKPGMPVVGMVRSGALAEYIAVPAAALKHLPAQVAFEVGASFQANYLTGLYALDSRAVLRAGETLLVLGAAGGVGIAAVQLGKLIGARVIAAGPHGQHRVGGQPVPRHAGRRKSCAGTRCKAKPKPIRRTLMSAARCARPSKSWVAPCPSGSWLNIQELEWSALARRLQNAVCIRWQFTTPDARRKLSRLYPIQTD